MKRICVLPVAGKEDPGQMLRMEGWRKSGRFEVLPGNSGRFFAATLTCLKYRPDILYFDWIGRYIDGRQPWITLAKQLAFYLDVIIVTKIFRRPIVWTLHNLRAHENSGSSGGEFRMQSFFARHVARIRVFSQSSRVRARELLGVDEGKFRVVPEGDFSRYYTNAVSSAEARTRLGLAAGEFVLLWLGSIRPYKGLHELLEAFQHAAAPHWRLLIAGKPYIEAYAREIVQLARGDSRITVHARFIPEDEMQYYYNAADVVVLPFAEVENSGSVCVAMGFRKAIVAPDLGVISERLYRQKELVYAPGCLVSALQKVATLPAAQLTAYGEANFAEITSYSWSLLTDIFQELEEKQAVVSPSSP